MNKQQITCELGKRVHFEDEASFIETLYSDIEVIIKLMEQSSDKYYCDDEDKLSHTIVASLVHLGYDATEQTKKNGSVDITVRPKNGGYTWIAEAKIGYGNQKIFEGLLQLLTRYVKRDNHAGMVIYYQKSKSSYHFKQWLKYIYNHEWKDYCTKKGSLKKATPLLSHLKSTVCPKVKQGCCYADIDVIQPSTDGLKLRCFYIDVHHDPIDSSGLKNKSIAFGQAQNRIRDLYHLWKTGQFDGSMIDELFEEIKIYHSNELDEEYEDEDEDEDEDSNINSK
ncbi:TPA: hypothetical protein ROA69_001790 [Escherichia coli]|uniref:hypothetical protein n=1 Tax=Escherichia coli TaxID=562 RepID=UPI000B4FF9D0|nr:hypothetical protein [Escherichia coli]EKK3461516.1 hypothetical protein [Escherichia coli O145]EHU7970086.1 hypothetical protein [Escherichia coli]EKC4163511.1 hypothetical protein [Escherichia coli]EKC5964811.1 hypothetical protein [Escherichia coli]EKC7156312.1 hypothetical protein [Escherichia coli]